MKTTLETSEDENYTQNEWKWKLHSKRVKMKTTLETSEDEIYTRNEWSYWLCKLVFIADITGPITANKAELHSKRV